MDFKVICLSFSLSSLGEFIVSILAIWFLFLLLRIINKFNLNRFKIIFLIILLFDVVLPVPLL